MKNIAIKTLLILLLSSLQLFGASEANIIFSKSLDKKYDEKIYRKTTILFTEARLKLQKKYKKFLNFEYVDSLITDKKDIIKFLKKNNARYYAYLTIKDKKKCKKNICQVDYIIKVVDAKKKKNTTLKIKAKVNNNEFLEVSPALIKSNTKKLVKFLK